MKQVFRSMLINNSCRHRFKRRNACIHFKEYIILFYFYINQNKWSLHIGFIACFTDKTKPLKGFLSVGITNPSSWGRKTPPVFLLGMKPLFFFPKRKVVQRAGTELRTQTAGGVSPLPQF